jgi:hypothetical protein
VEGVKTSARILAIVALAAMSSTIVTACSLAPIHGYFHQVTAIRGRVVGKSLGPFQFRWLRQSFSVSGARLALYEYSWPAQIEGLRPITTINADAHGYFDFGSISKGHYVLTVSVPNPDLLGGFFEVEVTDAVKATKNITIDVSPIHPDCTGGHEFVETKL